MIERRLSLPAGSPVMELARAIEGAGGRIIVVGGWVRDALRGAASHDLDLEVFGLAEDAVEDALAGFGFTARVGRQFPVWRRVRDGLDLAFARAGADAYQASRPDSLDAAFRVASRHRDLRVNAIGWDPVADRLIDPWDGLSDLRARRLRAVDPATFPADPVRLLRVARLQAILEAEVDDELRRLCQDISLDATPVERVAAELRRMLIDVPLPSQAFGWLADIGRLDIFPPLARLAGVPQDPVWHPEGDVLVHTLMVLDRARAIADELVPEAREVLLLAALCHDLGKPETTTRDGDRVRSLAHEAASAKHAREWLAALRFSERVVHAVAVLVAHHLSPSQFVAQGAGARAYRKLARKLAAAGLSLVDLERLARADHLGRTTAAALADRYEAGPVFLAAAESAEVREAPRADVVTAKALIERGVPPGPELGRRLRRCREIEDETGWREPSRILARCLAEP